MNTIFFGLLTGSDNLLFGAAMGLLPMSARRRLAFAAAFGAAEFGMTLAGALAGGRLGGSLFVACALVLSGGMVLLARARGKDLARLAAHPAALVLLPLALSLDNLAAGARAGEQGSLTAALSAGALSAIMAGAGLFVSAPLGRRRPRFAALLAGAGMVALAVPRVIEALS